MHVMTTKTPEEKAKHAAYMREWLARNPRKQKDYNLKRYGITYDEFDAIVESQGGACACCGRPFNPDPKMRDRQVDHDHGTGRMRGIVCAKCNYILGRHGKDIEILKMAVAYLERTS